MSKTTEEVWIAITAWMDAEPDEPTKSGGYGYDDAMTTCHLLHKYASELRETTEALRRTIMQKSIPDTKF